ncbi:Oligosaccharide translocation protein rft1 [Cichlidogyrus casuarinus]|uniref:Protein RFT1 homolog n=1 Tax=Cichlidogyrus casuarinus TaxID=1844966 RepID=A0ABD2Q8Q6_9PLAT
MILPVPIIKDPTIKLKAVYHQYIICVLTYSLSCLCELATEVFWLSCQLFLLVKERIYIEAIANSMRFLVIFLGLFCLPITAHNSMFILALPQIVHGVALLFLYLIFFRRRLSQSPLQSGELSLTCLSDLAPSLSDGFDAKSLHLCKEFYAQNVLKQFLTEGERYLISGLHLLSYSQQAIYDLVSNLASIPLRIIFTPMDESCHLVFSQSLMRGISPLNHDKERLRAVFRLYQVAMRASFLVSIVGVVFAQGYSKPFMILYTGIPEGVSLLRMLSVHVLVCGLNGPTEAFMHAAMSPKEIARFNWVMLGFSMLFLSLSIGLSRVIGFDGFVLANLVNIGARFWYALQYLREFIYKADRRGTENYLPDGNSVLLAMAPSKLLVIHLTIVLLVTTISQSVFCFHNKPCFLYHCGIIGVPSVLLTLFLLYREEKPLLQLLLRRRIN